MVAESSHLPTGQLDELAINTLSSSKEHNITKEEEQGGDAARALPSYGTDQARQPPDKDTELTYRYLTFETPLPKPNTTMPSSSSSSTPPPLPNLSRYGNPMHWSPTVKNTHLVLACLATFVAAYTAGAYSPPVPLMARDLHSAPIPVTAGITINTFGFGLAPMILCPFSEINGRYPLFVAAGILFAISLVGNGASTTLAQMLATRFLLGVGGSVFSSMLAGVMADVWRDEDRNTPMALFSGAVMIGMGMGPLVGGIFAERFAGDENVVEGVGATWRWVFWHQAPLAAALMVALMLLFRESRANIVLSRRAGKLNKWFEKREAQGWYGVWVCADEIDGVSGGSGVESSDEKDIATSTSSPTSRLPAEKGGYLSTDDPNGNMAATDIEQHPSSSQSNPLRLRRIRYLVASDSQRTSIAQMIRASLFRPFHLLFTEPVVFWFSLWVSFAWAILFLTFGSIPYVFTTVYNMSLEQSCRIFAAMAVGGIVSTFISIYQERLLLIPAWQADSTDPSRFWTFMRRRFPPSAPESRLYCACFTSSLLPIGLYIFGFTARPSIPLEVPAFAIALFSMGAYGAYLATFNYLADVYGPYASSALAAQSFLRNATGGTFPLFSATLFRNMGPSSGGAILGSLALGLGVVPWVLVWFGERIRRRSRFAVQLVKEV